GVLTLQRGAGRALAGRTHPQRALGWARTIAEESCRHARVEAAEEAGLHSPAGTVGTQAEPTLVGTTDGWADGPRPGLGGDHLPGTGGLADSRHRQLEPGHRFRDHDDRF